MHNQFYLSSLVLNFTSRTSTRKVVSFTAIIKQIGPIRLHISESVAFNQQLKHCNRQDIINYLLNNITE